MFKNLKTLFAQVFMVLLAASFLTWGANSYFVNTPKSIAIEVNGEKVAVSELQNEFNFRKREAEDQFGGKLSDEFLNAIKLGNATVNSVINSKLSLDVAKQLGFRASPQALRDQIINNPAFHDENGNFNKDVYRMSVSNYGFKPAGYEKLMMEEMIKQNLYDLFETEFTAEDYLKESFKHTFANMTIRALMLNDAHIDESPAITAAEIKGYYQANAHHFLTEETRDFATLVVRADQLKKKVNTTEAEARELFDADPEAFTSEEQREARHILVATEEEAIDLINQLDQGADFATLAKAHSTDTFTKEKGGSLGYFNYADMVESFSDAAFNQDIGAISDPVESPFGFHIIQVTAIAEEKPQTFAEVKDEIIADLNAEKAEDVYYETLDQVEDKIAAGFTLKQISDELGLALHSYQGVKQTAGSDVKFSADVMPVVTTLNEGQISDPILVEGQDTITLYAEVNKLNAERTLTIDEAREQILAELKTAKEQQLIKEKAQKLLIERLNKNNLSAVASAHNLTDAVVETANIKRNAAGAPKWLNASHIKLLFAMKAGEVMSTVVDTPDGQALVEVVAIENQAPDATQLELYQNQVSKAWQEDLFAQYMAHKRNQANIDINEPSIKFALGSAYVTE